MEMRPARLTAALCIAAGACSSDHPASRSIVVDSAGARITVSLGGSWTPEEAWTVDPEPIVRLGLRDTEAEHFLGVQRVRVRSDGSVVVLDGSSAEVRIFDRTGALTAVLGGDGDGPGELRAPRELHVVQADTILVWDNRGVTRFAPDGSFVSLQAVDVPRLRGFMPESMTIGAHGLPDGSVLAVGYYPPENTTGRVRNRMLYGRTRIDGETLDTLGWSLDREWWVPSSGVGQGRTLLGPQSFWAAGGSPLRIAISEGSEAEVRVYTAAGALEQIVRFPNVDRSIPPGAIRAAKDDRRDVPMPAAALERFLAVAPDPTEAPAMGGLLLDGAGFLWVLPYLPSEGAAAWTAAGLAHVFDVSGTMLGAVQLPIGLVLHDVGLDWIAGLVRSDLGVEVIQVHRLRREPNGPRTALRIRTGFLQDSELLPGLPLECDSHMHNGG